MLGVLLIEQTALILHFGWFYFGATALVQLFNEIFDQLGRVQLFVLVHKEVQLLQTLAHPHLYALHPVIYPLVVGRVQRIAYKSYKSFRC